ncbi:MAG: LysR family transcriptional regulator [Candidatus Thiodiazotropha sp.]
MKRDEIADLAAFVAVAEEKSFTRAAVRLAMSQSALSQIIRRLEEDVGLRLLSRTTRSVAPTEVGKQLLDSLAPLFKDIDASIAGLAEYRDKPVGTFRITTVEHAAKVYILPKLTRLLSEYPDIKVEIVTEYGLADVVSDQYDAGVRLGEEVHKDMIAVPISPEIPMAVVGSPEYFSRYPEPNNPKQLVDHLCVILSLPSRGAINEWRFTRHGENSHVRVNGPLTFNTIDLIQDAAVSGMGLAYLPLDQVQKDLDACRLSSVLDTWMLPLPPYYLYYPNRRHSSPAFRLIVDALKYF